MDPNSLSVMQGAAGAGGGGTKYVEEVFSTYVYDGTGTTQPIDNGIDLDGEGGLVWIKARDIAYNHALFDTENDVGNMLCSHTTTGIISEPTGVTAFNSNGFTMGGSAYTNSSTPYASWSFRKAPGFFDVVTYTGNGTAGRTVSHNLGCVPGMIIIKCTSGAPGGGWAVYHKSLGNANTLWLSGSYASTPYLYWNSTSPTATEFTLNADPDVNKGTAPNEYVAYLFADGDEAAAQIFGDDEDESIIKMGSFSYTGGTPLNVNLGWEPQWLLVKKSNGSDSWFLVDNMREMIDGEGRYLQASTANTEGPYGIAGATSTGFIFDPGTQIFSSGDFIYIAIRRGPMKTPEDATEVFAMDTGSSANPGPTFDSGFPVDFAIRRQPASAGDDNWFMSRLTGWAYMNSNTTHDEQAISSWHEGDHMAGWARSYSSSEQSWMFRRAPGFFDVVCYEGTGSARTVDHNLGVAPELILTKNRDQFHDWNVYSKTVGNERVLKLNNDWAQGASGTNVYWNSTTPTSSVFTVRESPTNISGDNYLAYLFATCPGVSKVGTYSGTGSDIDVDCGFTAGARFILMKRYDGAGSWYVFDTIRGIVSGADPHFALETNTAQVTSDDLVDPLSSGFTVHPSNFLNSSGEEYIYLAIA